MQLMINGNLPKETDIDGVPAIFLMPPQEEKFEQLDLSIPVKPKMATGKYTPYQERIRACFAAAYKFLDEHRHPRTLEDFVIISRALGKAVTAMPDPLLKDLLNACFSELEREFIAAGGALDEKAQQI